MTPAIISFFKYAPNKIILSGNNSFKYNNSNNECVSDCGVASFGNDLSMTCADCPVGCSDCENAD